MNIPTPRLCSLDKISKLKNIIPPWINVDFKVGQKTSKRILEHSVVLEGKELLQTRKTVSERSRSPLECSPTGQRWDNVNIIAVIITIVITTTISYQRY